MKGYWLLLMLLWTCMAEAQRGNDPLGTNADPTEDFPSNRDSLGELEVFERIPDTIRMVYLYADNPEQEYFFKDSLLTSYYHQYDPTRQRDLDYANLGNMGSAHQAIVYEPSKRQGFEVGLNQYKLYQIQAEQFAYYNIRASFSNLSYSQASNQNDSYFRAVFSRKFAKGINLAINYRRLGHHFLDFNKIPDISFNQNASYKLQGARHTALSTGIWYHHPKGNYDAFLSYSFNEINHLDHGGIIGSTSTDSILLAQVELENNASVLSVPIFQGTGSMETRQENRSYSLTQHLRFGAKPDTTRLASRKFTLSHQLNYTKALYKFSDTAPTVDYYGALYTDVRGARHLISTNSVQNSVELNTFKTRGQNTELKQQRDFLAIGLLHHYHNIYQEPFDTVVNNLFITGKWEYKPNERLSLKTDAHFALWDNAGDYRANADLFWDIGKIGALKASFTQQLYEPNLIQTRFLTASQEKWTKSFNKTLETQLAFTYAKPAWQLELTGRYILLNNYIYFDTTAFVRQEAKPISIGQLIGKQRFSIRNFHLENTVVLQQISEPVLRLPSLFSKHSLYFEGRLFKRAMLARMGFDLRMNSSYFANAYQALTGQFYLQNTDKVDFYPAVDVFFSFKVDRFRFFIKMENITAYASRNIYYSTPFYPQKERYLRFGISWLFLDSSKAKKNKKGEESTGASGGLLPGNGIRQ